LQGAFCEQPSPLVFNSTNLNKEDSF